MRIIGHRGAAGLALENTKQSITKALELGVDIIEIDVRLTADRQLVLSHDATLKKISTSKDPRKIAALTYAELKKIKLTNGECVSLLSEILELVGQTPIIIETKVENTAHEILDVLKSYPQVNASVASKMHREIGKIKSLNPALRGYVAGFATPVEILDSARIFKADGIDINFWTLNPLTYWLARRKNLDIIVYTVNGRLLARLLGFLYPNISICTDFPDRFLSERQISQSLALK